MAGRSDSLDAIARRLRLLRDALGLTQEAFAASTNVGRTSINNYERAIRRPDVDEAIRICAATGVNLHWLYTGEMSAYLPGDIRERIRGCRGRPAADLRSGAGCSAMDRAPVGSALDALTGSV
jgi:transcriptional regulator with XRE-family HTH domain